MKKIAILGAMEEEITPLLAKLSNIKETHYAGNIFYQAVFQDKELIIAYSQIGKVNASITATLLIEKFGTEILLFSGVAGALSPSLAIGDILIANKLCQYDVDITAFGHAHGKIPGSEVFSTCDSKLINLALETAQELNLKVSQGTIATADKFLSGNNTQEREFIINEFKADAVEMEGAAVSYICNRLNIPCLIIRTISDTADSEAHLDFNEFLNSSAKISANYIFNILDKI